MTYMDRLFDVQLSSDECDRANNAVRQALLIVVEDGNTMTEMLQPICDFLDIALERLPSECDLARALQQCRPMAVMTQLDGWDQDGCHVMKMVAHHDRDLPVLVLTGDELGLAGAVDAVAEICQLTAVTQSIAMPGVGAVVDFLFRAGHTARCTRLIPV